VPERIVRIIPSYAASAAAAGVRPRSTTARALARVILALAGAEHLPGADDSHGIAPGTGDVSQWAYARLVPRTGGVWLWYRADNESLVLVALSRRA
jgi:hypothetical protein